MSRVDVVHWNPRGGVADNPVGRRLPFGPRKRNFGDLLGPLIVALMVERRNLRASNHGPRKRLLSVGSILHLARTNDTVWGTGINGKSRPKDHRFRALDVRAVRGIKTHIALERMGIEVPAIYGDPALLLPHLRPELVDASETKVSRGVLIPNLNEVAKYRDHEWFMDPREELAVCLNKIVRSELVIASSLHGVVVGEAFGIETRLLSSSVEPTFKYDDYFSGTGRVPQHAFPDLDAAIRSRAVLDPPIWRPEPLLDAFPEDLWES